MMLPHISNPKFSATAFTQVLPAALIISCFSLSASAQTATNKPAVQGGTGKTYTILIPDYSNVQPDKIGQMTNDVQRQQELIKADLSSQLAHGKLSGNAEAQVIRLLGSLRAYQAVYLLIQSIDFYYDIPPSQGTSPTAILSDGYVAREALLQMGNMSIYAILEVIGSRSKDAPFDQAHVNGYCWTLNALHGKTFATQQLQQQLAAEKDPKVQAQYRSVLARMKAYPAD